MTQQQALSAYMIRLGDNCLIMAQRLAEWCSKGPILEEDLALTNVSLDLFGQAESFYNTAVKYDASLISADHLAFRRDERDFYNHLLAEQENGDYAVSMLKLYLFSTSMRLWHEHLLHSKNDDLKLLSEKAIKEIRYHVRHSGDWVNRLGNGTTESHARLQLAVNELWRFTDDLFLSNELDENLFEVLQFNLADLKPIWLNEVQTMLQKAGLNIPERAFMVQGGINGIHTEGLGHLLCEMQYLQRAYPDAVWQ